MVTIRPLGRLLAAAAAALALGGNAAAGPMVPYSYASSFSAWGANPLWASLKGTNGGTTNGELYITQSATVGYALPTPLSQPPQGASPFLLNVTLTDQISGEAGTYTFAGTAFEQNHFSGNRWVYFSGLADAPVQTQELGDGRFYSVDLELRRGNDGRQYVDALVTIETPEPATLVMAGLGLAGLAAARRRNRAVTTA